MRCEEVYLVFDDTVIDKRYAKHIELVRRLYSSNEHRVIRGIGLISCLYVNPHSGTVISRWRTEFATRVLQFWVINYRLYDTDGDGKTKLDHVLKMFQGVLLAKSLPFRAVLMDSWYAAQKVMAAIDQAHKLYYCPLKRNRLIDDSRRVEPYRRIDQLYWSETELAQGKLIKIRSFPKDKKVKLFRVTVRTAHGAELNSAPVSSSTDRTKFVATNDIAQDSMAEIQQVCRIRWKIEEFHRKLKQLTGLEACQCRKAHLQRNHVACALLVWIRLKHLAYQGGQTVYQLKRGLFSKYLIAQLKSPAIPMVFA